ncbi:enoyl-CoA hydratase/isomerase family protein, partial [Rhizobium ruizarguesonis]
VPTGNALAAAREYARRIAARGPAATEIAKLMIASANGEDNGTAVEALGSILAAKTGDLKEGVASFSEKRPATYPDIFSKCCGVMMATTCVEGLSGSPTFTAFDSSAIRL